MIKAMQHATGRVPVVVGKGGDWLLGHLKQRLEYDPARVCGVSMCLRSEVSVRGVLCIPCLHQTAMVGDRLDTDIALGKQGGLVTVLVLTGVATLDDVQALSASERPDFVLPSLAGFIGH